MPDTSLAGAPSRREGGGVGEIRFSISISKLNKKDFLGKNIFSKYEFRFSYQKLNQKMIIVVRHVPQRCNLQICFQRNYICSCTFQTKLRTQKLSGKYTRGPARMRLRNFGNLHVALPPTLQQNRFFGTTFLICSKNLHLFMGS